MNSKPGWWAGGGGYFPGSPVVKNPYASAEDTGSRETPRDMRQRSLCATTTEAHAPRVREPQHGKPLQWAVCVSQQGVAAAHCT